MSSAEHTVFVSSATGYQGLPLAKKLREMGWNVHATTRDLSSPAALTLQQIGVQLKEADWDNLDVLRESIQTCDKLWLCLLPDWDDPTRERRQVRRHEELRNRARPCIRAYNRQCANILDIAKEAGVKQVVASTTLGVSQLDANVRLYPGSFMEKHMLNKKAVENAVEERAFEHFTFLRPTFFMANFLEPKVKRYAEIRDHHTWTTSMTADTQLPILDHLDIAKFAVAAFEDPERFHGRKIGLASDQMGIQDMLTSLAEAAGQPGSIKAHFMTDDEIEAQAQGTGFATTHKVLRTASHYIDFEELRAIVPSLTSFAHFLNREKETVRQTYAPRNE